MNRTFKKICSMFLAAALLCTSFLYCAPSVQADTPVEGYSFSFESYSKALYLENMDTGMVVYAQNPDERMYPASMTKIMTYIVAYENVPNVETAKATVTQECANALSGTGSSVAGLIVGEELTVLQLLNLMMVPSGNDAAYVLAEYIGGGDVDVFVQKMNEKAAELGCEDTHFMNPHGLHDENHYTTCRDMAKIARYALSLPFFSDIVSQTYYTLDATNMSEERMVYATNRMLNQNVDNGKYYYKFAKGIKTGTTDEAGYCLCGIAVRNGYTYLSVAMGCPSVDENGDTLSTHGEMLDTKALYEWAFDEFEMKSVLTAGEVLAQTELKYVWDRDTLQLMTNESCVALLPKDVDVSSVLVTPHVPEYVEAPVNKGDKIGTATLSYAGRELATVDLVASGSWERSDLVTVLDQSKNVVSSRYFMIGVGVVIMLIALYVVLYVIYNVKRRNLHKENTRRR